MKRILFPSFIAVALVSTAFASPQAPSLKPAPQYLSKVISSDEFADLEAGLNAADDRDWTRVRYLMKQQRNPDAANLLLWEVATTASANASFSELDKALNSLQDWPYRSAIQREAEARLRSSGLSAAEREDWLTRHPPRTGEGKYELSRLLRNKGKTAEANALIRDIWRNNSLPMSTGQEILSQYGGQLTADDHSARVQMLLWTGQRSEARRMLSRLTSNERKLAEARLGLMEGRRGVDALIDAVPSAYQNDPGLLYERARWRRKKLRNQEGATELLLQIKAADATVAGREKIWDERHIAIRDLIKAKDWKTAYALAADHGLSEGIEFAEAEFISGWLALRKLKKPEEALVHFDSLAQGVSTPVSRSRGDFWRGETLKSLGRQDDAKAAYAEAAAHIFTFYGQLAAERLEAMGGPKAEMSFAAIPEPSDQERAAFAARPVVRAARLMAETGRIRTFERFSNSIDDTLKTAQEQQMLFDLAVDFLLPRAGVRGGKEGLAMGVVSPDAAFPVIELPPSMRSGVAEPALVIALSRQESELTPTAVSSANARGMMQIIPATARNTARMVGAPYRTSWLTDDPEYNMRIGRSFLDSLIDRFDGSYIMALAAYNAGPSRPIRWIDDYGDPRSGEIDPVDWIESIPFSETRNYVQRIMENLQVYRHRLAQTPTPITLTDDLERGARR